MDGNPYSESNQVDNLRKRSIRGSTDIGITYSCSPVVPTISPTLPCPVNCRTKKIHQFFGDPIMVDGIPSQLPGSGFLTISQTWIPLCYFMRFCYRENLLQNLLCYLELERILANQDKGEGWLLSSAAELHRRFLSLNFPHISAAQPANRTLPSAVPFPIDKAGLIQLRLTLIEVLSDCYLNLEKSRFYCEMSADLDGSIQLLADLKVKALRHLDSELGIFTHNFELLPNVDLLYKFRKYVLMVQPTCTSARPYGHNRTHKGRTLSVASKPPHTSPRAVMNKLEALISNFNSARE
ncbi:hypothetical protein L0F63_002567, partial [Massospora cicadina]